ncbi:MAG: LamG-like jellyroll fold domain-containing protein [Caulobacteraceae bacterium]
MPRAGWVLVWSVILAAAGTARAQVLGPYNADFPHGGGGLLRPLPGLTEGQVLPANEPWSLYGWIAPSELPTGRAIIAGVGDPAGNGRFLELTGGGLGVLAGGGETAVKAHVRPGAWAFVAAVSDGSRTRFYVDERLAGENAATDAPARAVMSLAPRGVVGFEPYAGRIAGLVLARRALSPDEIAALAKRPPDPTLTQFDTGSPHWPLQVRQMMGQVRPQNAWTLPTSGAPVSAPRTTPSYDGPTLVPDGDAAWTLKRWTLVAAPDVSATGETLSTPGYDDATWWKATVPGTVLTTLIDRGVYPDPNHGLNNLAIPEKLAHQDYWYRATFSTPPGEAGRHALLTFHGINYAAEVWLNGEKLGNIRGAFIRGRFDITDQLRSDGANVLAVRISPPPHPGLPEEESIAAGPGENGGMEALDGPTFIASEGWDWIPTVRDRNSGIWQNVTLSFSGPLRIGDPQVVTTLPKPDNSLADVAIDVPVDNLSASPLNGTVTAKFGDISLSQTLLLPAGATTVRFDPSAYPALEIRHPQLWWPNGYGPATLQTLTIGAAADGAESDRRTLSFGLRQITYVLSLMDASGHVRRYEVDFAKARNQQLIDVRHEAIRKTPDGWVESLTAAGMTSLAVTPATDAGPAPFLTLKVNGVRIAARGGSWGMDDWLKRVDRNRLEPYFRLHRDAGLNVIRNWVGQNTEEAFYDLADEYGLLVLNDFWESTQDYQLEPDDPDLFLANAADVITRDRIHPSIALWFGRNEGVPQPVLNEGLERLVREEDGTRWYTPSSNRIELQDSGPYDYRPPADYFAKYAKGFAVEVGSPSFPSLEAFAASVDKADRWPISDAWAYHDWHQAGNGDVAGFMRAMEISLGAPADIADFERKAQLMNYETFRAIFEGMNAGLWRETSGRLLWMTQPAWPSTEWQILSHDYDTHAAFYGVKAAAEPLHAQLNLATDQVDVVDTTRMPMTGGRLRARVVGLDGRTLSDASWPVSVSANDVAHGPVLPLAGVLAKVGAAVVRLELADGRGTVVSRNTYWLAKDAAAERALSAMPAQPVRVTVRRGQGGGEALLLARLENLGAAPAIEAKLTLVDSKGERILPAYYSDNYLSLLPGEAREVEIRFPLAQAASASLDLRGWNVAPLTSVRPMDRSSGLRP